jgi:hypothetical protein
MDRCTIGRPFATLAALGLVGCGIPPEGYVQPEVPSVPVVASAEAAAAAEEQDVRPETLVVSAEEAEARGLEGTVAFVGFGPDQDGTKLLVDFLEKARARGARYVSDVNLYLGTSLDGAPAECRIAVHPADTVVKVEVPARYEHVPISTPVTRSVTEYVYRCRPTMKPVMRSETHYENRCRMVTRPVMRMETTYTTQYDAFSRTSRSVPQTRMVTHQESHNECRMEPATRMVSKTEYSQECRMEPETRTVTRYEFQLQARFVPPHLEMMRGKKLVSSEPVCYAPVDGPAPDKGNRIEAKIYLPRRR